ncbi:FCD domain-containing protein [Pseudoroseomonas wenyumeiae]|uniref:FCD domain-containing protein n=1 Tax=Teichococcus wenyumeiae TaxID=2478470 RepID=A0A3A9K2I2_9PROT|nr:GntR family transcriptional regulator [Pseudoroseomonas wenyumeiae]RKK05549.1 GntR family transcriptional regulator [Pseudoroseomonas wenyumeiae]RMI20721.1 FCD domain-containing protein [Pseudoroseomonas wenyumeiae]
MPASAITDVTESAPSLEERAYDSIRRALMGGTFVPGDRLSIRQVAAALGTSPMPARAALQRLVAEQVLEVLPSGTAVVPLLTRTSFIELRAIRAQLEPLAASLAAPNMDKPGLRRLETWIDSLEASLARGDMEAVLTQNQHFMFDIYRAARAPMLLGIIETLWLRRGPMYWGARAALLRWKAPFTRHKAAVAALRAGDGVAAGAAIRDEIESTTDFLLAEIQFADDPPQPSGVSQLEALKRGPARAGKPRAAAKRGARNRSDA